MTRQQLDEYIAFRSDIRNVATTDGMWASQQNIPLPELKQFLSLQSVQDAILKLQRSRYSSYLADVDRALFAKAMSGDTKAAALLYAKFEGWTPRVAEADAKKTGGQRTLAQIIKGDV